MTINPGNGATNTSLIEASGGGTLNLGGSVTNTGGTILSTGSGSTVNLAGAGTSTITGGTLTTAGGSVMNSDGSTLSGLTISSGSTVSTANSDTTTLTGSRHQQGHDRAQLLQRLHQPDPQRRRRPGGHRRGSLTLSGSIYNRIYGSGSRHAEGRLRRHDPGRRPGRRRRRR